MCQPTSWLTEAMGPAMRRPERTCVIGAAPVLEPDREAPARRAGMGVCATPPPGTTRDVDDSNAQFFVTVGNICADARLAGLTVRLSLDTGEQVTGVPEPPPETEGSDELDNTGYADVVPFDGIAVPLSEVVEVSLRRPPRA